MVALDRLWPSDIADRSGDPLDIVTEPLHRSRAAPPLCTDRGDFQIHFAETGCHYYP